MKFAFYLSGLICWLFLSSNNACAKASPSAVSAADSIAFWKEIDKIDLIVRRDLDSAIMMYNSLALRTKRLNWNSAVCNINIGLAMCYKVKGQSDIALEILSENVKYFKNVSLKDQVATYRLLLETSQYTLHKENAVMYGMKALAINKILEPGEPHNANNAERLDIYGGLANVYIEHGNFDSARYYLDRYRKELDPKNSYYPFLYAHEFESEGHYYSRKGDVRNGLASYRQAAVLYNQMDPNTTYKLRSSSLIFEMYVDNNFFAEAKKYIADLKASEVFNSISVRASILPKLARIDSADGNFKSAYALLKKALELKDSIQSEEILSRTIYYTNVIGLQEANTQLLQKTNAVRNTRYSVLLIAVISTGLLISLLIYFRNRKLRMILGHQQELKEISNDLHDEINPILGYARMMLSRVEAENEDDKLLLQKSNVALLETMNNLRMLTRQMNDSSLYSLRYQETLREMVLKICGAYGFKALIDVSFNDKLLSEIVKRNLFLIVQELVHNSMKYSNGSGVFLRMKTDHGHQLNVTYADDGVGMDNTESTVEILLPKIAKRVSAMQGHAAFSTLKDYPGVCIVMEIPIKNKVH